ncbi:hypothetical protein IQ07DRAFT_646284 [Pyrenochaeta sp. DS3sAY3a]|nr:hypothetical protein IQ07DRAFT_646284 [Pyrenochaeta sp. DS3sAY3a]
MSSAVPSSIGSAESNALRLDFAHIEPNPNTPFANNYVEIPPSQNPTNTLATHYKTLQEHANHFRGAEAGGEDHGLTPRHGERREGFNWGKEPVLEDQRRLSFYPLPPGDPTNDTPPPLEDIVRGMRNSDGGSIRNVALNRTDSNEPTAPEMTISRSSTTCEGLSRTDTRRSSITAFARGLARHMSDMKRSTPPGETNPSNRDLRRRDSQDATYFSTSKKGAKLSSPLQLMDPCDTPHVNVPTALQVMDKPKHEAPASPTLLKSSLRERRKVKLDLSLPTEITEIPERSRTPAGAFTSVTPSRPRSPRTPWIRNEPHTWERVNLARSATILEEDYIQYASMNENGAYGTDNLSGSTILAAPQVQTLVQLPVSMDQHYQSHSQFQNNVSGPGETNGKSSTVPRGIIQRPNFLRQLREHQAPTQGQLQDHGIATSKSGRRRWGCRTSSDDISSPPVPLMGLFSSNPFKRTKRVPGVNGKAKKQTESSNRAWRGKQSTNTGSTPLSSLAHITVPPVFIPPGLSRVPTPPMFDAHGEVKGKLADFFFDVQSQPGATRRRDKTSSGRHWDSDALLMSLSSDIQPEDEDDEEGPEGRPTRTTLNNDFDTNGTPGLLSSPVGYLGIQGTSPSLMPPDPSFAKDNWFNMQYAETPNEHALAHTQLDEEEERRRFEWLVPEHLPSSPLCPLHSKYKGPYTGMCCWHGKREADSTVTKSKDGNEYQGGGREGAKSVGNGAGVGREGERRSRIGRRGWEVGLFDALPKEKEGKKRRLDSLSSP